VFLLLFSQSSVNLDVSSPGASGGSNLLWLLVAIAILVVIAGVVALVVVPRVRRLVLERLRHWIPQVRSTFAGLRSPKKLGQLIGGNVAGELLFATALGLMCLALGYHISLTDLLVINISVSLFSSFIPIPGGIGVVEGGLMVGLSGVGVPQSAALAIAILYRICTFYLPPVAGWFAMRWLTRNSYL
jgi:glycosyltransferase 2 family protein